MIDVNKAEFCADLIIDAYAGIAPVGARGLPNGRGFVWVDRDAKVCRVVIPGTHDLHDVLVDADVREVEPAIGRVHEGFWNEFKAIWPVVLDEIGRTPANFNICITGHSLGAAVAAILVVQLGSRLQVNDQFKSELEAFLFACPLVGNEVFGEHYRATKVNSFLFENFWDLVPRSPDLPGYAHVSAALRFKDNRFDLVANHAITTYRDNLGLFG